MKKLTFFIIVLALMFTLFKVNYAQTYKSLENGIDSLFNLGDLAGFSSCIVIDKDIEWTTTRGMADLKKGILVNNNTLFMLASLSKTVTGAALMTLYDKGKFAIDDDINLYMPFQVRNPNFPDIPITFRMLLTHTSSLYDNNKYVNSLYGCGDQTHISFEEYLRSAYLQGGVGYDTSNFAKYKPGDKWEYCNSGYVFIAYLIEQISKMPFTDYCQQNIFNPLEMNESGWLYTNLNPEHIALNYISEVKAKEMQGDPGVDSETIGGKNAVCHYSWPGYSDGILHTSPAQFANFMIMLMNQGQFKGKQLLKPETVQLILTPQNVNMFTSPRYKRIDMGLTWWLKETDDEYYFSHGGGGDGITTLAFFEPNKKYGAVFFITGDWHDKMYDRQFLDIFRKYFKSMRKVG